LCFLSKDVERNSPFGNVYANRLDRSRVNREG
jgi:hypothetical protein